MSARTVQDCENAVPALIFGAAATVTEGGADLLEPAVSSAVDDVGSLLLSPNIVAHASSEEPEASALSDQLNSAQTFTGRRLPLMDGPSDGFLVKRSASGDITKWLMRNPRYDCLSINFGNFRKIGNTPYEITSNGPSGR
jgi:hypothetical protein